MQKSIYILALFISYGCIAFAQGDMVNWEISSKKVDDRVYEISLKADIKSPWHIYSQFSSQKGPAPAKIVLNRNAATVIDTVVKELGNLHEIKETSSGVKVKQYEDTVTFIQTIKLRPGAKTIVEGVVQYTLSNGEKVIPQKKPFMLLIGGR